MVGFPSKRDLCFSGNEGISLNAHLGINVLINIDKPMCIRRKPTYRNYGVMYRYLQPSELLSDCKRFSDELVEVCDNDVPNVIIRHARSSCLKSLH